MTVRHVTRRYPWYYPLWNRTVFVQTSHLSCPDDPYTGIVSPFLRRRYNLIHVRLQTVEVKSFIDRLKLRRKTYLSSQNQRKTKTEFILISVEFL